MLLNESQTRQAIFIKQNKQTRRREEKFRRQSIPADGVGCQKTENLHSLLLNESQTRQAIFIKQNKQTRRREEKFRRQSIPADCRWGGVSENRKPSFFVVK